MDAIEFLEKKVRLSSRNCITFLKRTNEFNYVKFLNGNGCYSYIGKIEKSPQEISLNQNGCLSRNTIVHEIMHALGKTNQKNTN